MRYNPFGAGVWSDESRAQGVSLIAIREGQLTKAQANFVKRGDHIRWMPILHLLACADTLM